MKYFFYPCFFIFLSCVKKDECFTIREKASQNNNYYFLDRTDNLEDRDEITGQISVSLEIYNQYSEGDVYCVD